MVVKGRLLRIKYNDGSSDATLTYETQATLTISESFINYTGNDSRCQYAKKALKSWTADAQMLFDSDDLSYLISSMANGTTPTFTFGGVYVGGNNTRPERHIFTISGPAIVQKIDFAAQGQGLLSISFSVQGTGAPTITIS